MATRVNTRFVVLLSFVLIIACAGVVGTFVFLMYHTAADLARIQQEARKIVDSAFNASN